MVRTTLGMTHQRIWPDSGALSLSISKRKSEMPGRLAVYVSLVGSGTLPNEANRGVCGRVRLRLEPQLQHNGFGAVCQIGRCILLLGQD